jgi:hypothetical protein
MVNSRDMQTCRIDRRIGPIDAAPLARPNSDGMNAV